MRPGAAQKEGGLSFGGEITGRMNLLAPSEDPSARAQPSLPAPPASPTVFSPQRLDRMDPKVLDLDIPKLTAPPVRPVAPATAPPAATQAALPPAAAPIIKQTLALSASFAEGGPKVPGGVKWRVFTDQPDANGEHMLVAESADAAPRFDLDPGNYVVHAVYGLVSVAKYVTVDAARPTARALVLPAGAVRLTAIVGDGGAPADKVTFALTRDEGGVPRAIAANVKPGALLRLPAGDYHVTSTFGDANSIVDVDLKIGAGKLVEAQVHHKAAQVQLKLVDRPGGAEMRDTSWTILTPGGDVIRDSIGALPNIVLAEGDYTAIARHDGRMFQRNFAVKSGADESVEVAIQ
ncbi:hypothetical protein [Hansschlegelia sp. KR7-227]|uniref:hypothetical protein n=1 Tax=Hansschlegelia sp. KR7-227 TaxID=3400914 RepID=UPI003C073384